MTRESDAFDACGAGERAGRSWVDEPPTDRSG